MFASTFQFWIKHVGIGGPRRSLIDPRSQHADLLRDQRALSSGGITRRDRDRARDAVHKRARQAVTCHQHGTVLAAFHHSGFDRQIQTAFFVSRRVTFETVLAKNRLHIDDESLTGRRNGGRQTVRQTLERIGALSPPAGLAGRPPANSPEAGALLR